MARELFDSRLLATMEAARLAAEPFESIRRETALMRAAGGYGAAGLATHESAIAMAAAGAWPSRDRIGGLDAMMRAQAEADRLYRAAFAPGFVDRAEHIAQLAAGYALPSVLERFRTPTDDFVDRILRMSDSGLGVAPLALSERPQIEAFARASAMADMFADSERLTRGVREAVGVFSITDMPQFANLAGYRNFFDAAGLRLSHWPRRRLLTMAEKRRRLKARLQANSAPPHVKRAKTLVHRYELTLREISRCCDGGDLRRGLAG